MSQNYPISSPAAYVAPVAIGFADEAGNLVLVSGEAPLPAVVVRPEAPAPLAGATSQSLVAGPYAPLAGVPLHLELSGEWAGSATLQRSTDGGATRGGLTAGGLPWARFEANANEVVWEEGERAATFYLDIALESGTLNYRLSQ